MREDRRSATSWPCSSRSKAHVALFFNLSRYFLEQSSTSAQKVRNKFRNLLRRCVFGIFLRPVSEIVTKRRPVQPFCEETLFETPRGFRNHHKAVRVPLVGPKACRGKRNFPGCRHESSLACCHRDLASLPASQERVEFGEWHGTLHKKWEQRQRFGRTLRVSIRGNFGHRVREDGRESETRFVWLVVNIHMS